MVILDHCQFPDLDGRTLVVEEGVLVFKKCTLKYQEVMGIMFGTDSEIVQKKSIWRYIYTPEQMW